MTRKAQGAGGRGGVADGGRFYTAPPSGFPPRSAEVASCYRCKEPKPLDQFARDASKASGRKSICKGCDKAKSKRYYAGNRERVIARVTRRAAR